MREKKKQGVLSLVWKHWKPVYQNNKGYLIAITIFYSIGLSLDALFRPTQYKKIFDLLTVGAFEWTPVLYIAFSLGGIWLANRTGDFFTVFAETKIIKELQNSSMSKLLKKSTSFYTETTSGGLVAKSKRFARVSETIIDEFVYSINKAIILIIGIVIYISIVVPSLTIVFVVWIVLYLTATISLSLWREKYDLLTSEADSETTSKMSDIFLSITTLRVFSAVHRTKEDFFQTTAHEQRKRRNSWYIGNLQWAIQAFLTVILEIVCMYIVIQNVLDGIHTIGTLILVQSYLVSLASYMWGFGRSVVKVRTAFTEAYEMSLLLDNPDIESPTDNITATLLDNAIELENVTFGYDSKRTVLSGINFLFKPGYRYGLVGKTGSGKTTITKLLLRLHDIDEGSIRIGTSHIEDIDRAILRRWISYVPQNPDFPSWTIREIVTMGKPRATDEEIQLAAEKASCDFIWERLSEGYDTVIGERGVKLSGGERQRIALAAAILKDAPIVIMDEPTSALDAKTEHSIQQAIKEHFKGKTLIVIAHRLSTVAELDEIILLSDGQIQASGPHEQLLQYSYEYREMWDLQTIVNHS